VRVIDLRRSQDLLRVGTADDNEFLRSLHLRPSQQAARRLGS
jgi:hypothetical protein